MTLAINPSKAQMDIYPVTSGELLFQWSDVEQRINGQMEPISGNMRFTSFLNIGQYWHMDFTDNVGLYSGLAIRNVGFINEDGFLKEEEVYDKIKQRSYTLGLPLAIKLGSFSKHFYIFGGAEYELLFHYKEKYWKDGQKYKTTEWFSKKTKRFVPSLFAGIQLPRGLNLKFKYYLDDFLNHDYRKGDIDYGKYGKTQVFYLSVCWQFNTKEFKRIFEPEFFETALR
ncbi:hypothetical protein DMA11_15365 [Marinilabiliaceae bacterium JC017]|nr:hypothetical protein DMA11_15365 [Marinilabiliaceae bacterium JC017]